MHRKKILILLPLVILVIAGISATKRPLRNLKVLPQDISDAKLDSIMHSYNIALGEKCTFCHVAANPIQPDKIDYASDKEPMKEEARKMMRMVIEINKNNFHFDKNVDPVYLKAVTCKTCHRGQPLPQD
jgi:hypothetical protein